ncbi:uncharacterized protein LOC124161487 [Ischnura elegans]|uniref:uncharacterized protein LOC124161487 n=1 Tax=Ischnura elegans TaxID=197161 RepID=UPI001ED89DCA|nr:uncharacterized protein LOC124161487 [Ischnura elegans]
MEQSGSSVNTSAMLTSSFIHIVNRCLNEYYREPRSSFGALSYPATFFQGRIFNKKDIEEYNRSRSFSRIFHDLAKANHWHQAITFLLNCVEYFLPPVPVLQNILDTMLLIDAESLVVEAQLYLHQLLIYYPPRTDDMAMFYWEVLKEEELAQKRVSSPVDPCGSFINVLHQLETELNNIDQKNISGCSLAISVRCLDIHKNTGETNDDREDDEDENALEHNEEILQLCDATLLTGKYLKFWWDNASCEERVHRLLYVLSIMNEIMQLDINVWKSRSPEAQKHPLARPIISRLIWQRNDINPSAMIVRMIISMYAICHKNDLFDCMKQMERLLNFIALTLPSSPWDEGEGFPPDSHQRRVFAQYVATALIDSGLSDNRVEAALARLSPDWFRLLVSTKVHNHRSEQSHGDLPLNVVQLAKMIIQGLSWGDEDAYQFDSSECSDEEDPSPEKKGRKKKSVKRNAKGETQIHVQARCGNSEKLSQILAKEGKNINLADNAGWTAMHEAVSHEQVECVKVLCRYKPDEGRRKLRNQRRKSDESSKKNRLAVNLHAKGGEMGITPLHEAVMRNNLQIASILLKYGGPSLLNDTTNAGLTALDLASDERMKYLLKDRKLEGQKVEKKWLSEMKLSATHIPFMPSDLSCFSLRCMLLTCYLEVHCLYGITEKFKKIFRKSGFSKSPARKYVDYLERHHDVKALRYFRRTVKSHLSGRISVPEAYLLIFLC